MILNADGVSVWTWDGESASLCPDCGEALIAKRPEHCVWHWSHKGGHGEGCSNGETAWHLAMKYAYLTFPGWKIEQPIRVDGKHYRIDAARQGTRRIREFVHTLSDREIAKHEAFGRYAHLDCLWIMDGQAFASERRRWVKNAGIAHFLKPKAFGYAIRLGACVHFCGGLWRHWQDNVWFQMKTDTAAEICTRYIQAVSRKPWEATKEDRCAP